MFVRKLQALGYPHIPPSESITTAYSTLTSAAFRTLVVWLEFTKIRFYPVERRGPLKAIDAPDWTTTFVQYLKDLECTRRYKADGMTPEEVQIVVEWLLSQAIAAEYSDHAGELNTLSRVSFIGGGGHGQPAGANQSAASSAGSRDGASAGPLLDCTSESIRPAFEKEVAELANIFKIPFERDQLVSIIRVIRKRVEESIIMTASAKGAQRSVPSSTAAPAASTTAAIPSSASAQPASSSNSGGSNKPSRFVHKVESVELPRNAQEAFAVLDRMELGFPSTGDSLVDHAAQVFRLLFLHDLRSSQNLANELLMLAQEYTSDPKTDAKLGKVGV